jgi:DNA-binding beta-propeller fold protein YncE
MWILAIVAAAVVLGVAGGTAYAQADPSALPDPFSLGVSWTKAPGGRAWGQVIGVDIDPDGKSVWIFERCGGTTCVGSDLAPIQKFDWSGKLVKSFGAGMFVQPHGFFVDKGGNVWATDATGQGGKGHQVFKFSPDGKVLLTLGKAGIAGDGPDTFNRPSDVLVAPNGDIFVADGHGGDSNARIVKFTPEGKFIKAWGKHGKGPGEFDELHSLAMDSKGRLFVADRGNNRIEIFDQEGKFIAEWKQFGRPGALLIDKHDMLYSSDSESNNSRNPGWKRGIRIGSTKDGKVTAFIPDTVANPGQGPEAGNGTGPEGIAMDGAGNLYGAVVLQTNLLKYVRK